MKRDKWIWMPHAGHFICGPKCQFKLNTYVGGYIVSTVGELTPFENKEHKEFENIGCDRKYETMVFKAMKTGKICCPYAQKDGAEIDYEGYNTANDATKGHMKMCEKWAKKSK